MERFKDIILFIYLALTLLVFVYIPFQIIFQLLNLVGGNIILNFILTVVCMFVGFVFNAELIVKYIVYFLYTLSYITTNGRIAIVFKSKEEFFEKVKKETENYLDDSEK